MINKIKSIPHVFFFRNSSDRSVIEKDILRWIQIYAPKRSSHSMFENLAWLLKVYPEFRNLFYFRVGSYKSILGRSMLFLTKVFYKPLSNLRFFMPSIGSGLFIQYGFGTIIGAQAIGDNCWISQGVTIGYKDGGGGLPIIGDNVFIGAGSRILGPVNIGDNVIIGANAIVIKDVPADCTIVGVPARIIKRNGVRVNEPLLN